MKNLTATRFRILLAALVMLSIGVGVFASWRECSGTPNRSESAESNALLDIVVKSLVPIGAAEEPDHLASAFIKGLGEPEAKRMLESLADIDKRLWDLYAAKRLRGRYSIDMDQLSVEIKQARHDAKSLYGSDFDVALAAIGRFKIGTTLSQLTWKEDLPEGRRTSEYWQKYVARAHEGFLSHKNPWGALSGNVLVQDTATKDEKGHAALLLVSGNQAADGDQEYEEVRKKYPEFALPSQPVISDSMRAMLDYDDRRKLVDRKNHVNLNGKDVPAGYNVLLTINPKLQELASHLTDNALSAEHIKNATLVAMDIKSGEILAAASASEGSAGQGLVFRTIAPASTSKIIFAAAMLEQPESLKNSKQLLSQLPYYLMISDPQKIFFLPAAFNGAAKPIMDQAVRFGWNQDCQHGESCVGRPMDFLYGSSNNAAANAPINGRIMVAETNKQNRFRLLTAEELQQLPEYKRVAPLLEQGLKRPSDISKDSYDAAKVVRMSMFGQGDARTSPFGLLHSIAHVAGAANSQKEVMQPHLVRSVMNSSGKTIQTAAPSAVPVGMKPENARLLAGYLAAVNSPQGTAGQPFKQVFGRTVSQQDMLFAKTGTTDSKAKGSTPLYLYLAAYSRNGKEYDTAVVAICERKVLQERSYNYAADLALRFIKATKAEAAPVKQATAKPASATPVRKKRTRG